MLPCTLRASRQAWIDGAVLGALVLVSYVAQAYGLQFISSNRSAFLTSLNVLMVLLLGSGCRSHCPCWPHWVRYWMNGKRPATGERLGQVLVRFGGERIREELFFR